jgi:hypothetical protein
LAAAVDVELTYTRWRPDFRFVELEGQNFQFNVNFGFRHALRAFWRVPNRCAPKGTKSAGQAAVDVAASDQRGQHSVLGPWPGWFRLPGTVVP